jgi:hypothetical protein
MAETVIITVFKKGSHMKMKTKTYKNYLGLDYPIPPGLDQEWKMPRPLRQPSTASRIRENWEVRYEG